MRKNAGDEALRRAEREAAGGDPAALVRYVKERQRRGLPVTAWELQAVEPDPRERLRYLIAAREELPSYTDVERRYRDALGEVNIRAMAALRPLAPRIRRSKRRDVAGLEAWAAEVVGQEAVTETMAPFVAERHEVEKHYQAEAQRMQDRLNEIGVLTHRVAWQAEPRRGLGDPEFTFRRTSTYQSQGTGADYYARNSARDDEVFLASQGFDSRIERDPGEERQGHDWHGRPNTFRTGDGYRVFVIGVLELLDAEILRLRQDGWTYPSHYFGHDEYYNGSITEAQQRAWSHERFQALGWDPQPGRPGDCCPMTVERMKHIYAERGPLKPSWLVE